MGASGATTPTRQLYHDASCSNVGYKPHEFRYIECEFHCVEASKFQSDKFVGAHLQALATVSATSVHADRRHFCSGQESDLW